MKKGFLLSICLAVGATSISAGDIVEDALINDPNYKVSGVFGWVDFPPYGDNSISDWVFTTPKGVSYQLNGTRATDNNIFGWKKVNVKAKKYSWYMIQLHSDIDGDGSRKYDWVLLSTNMKQKAAYKLVGRTAQGTFRYSKALKIDYISGDNGKRIKTGFYDTLEPRVEIKDIMARAIFGGSDNPLDTFTGGHLVIPERSNKVGGYFFENNTKKKWWIDAYYDRITGKITGNIKSFNGTLKLDLTIANGYLSGGMEGQYLNYSHQSYSITKRL